MYILLALGISHVVSRALLSTYSAHVCSYTMLMHCHMQELIIHEMYCSVCTLHDVARRKQLVVHI